MPRYRLDRCNRHGERTKTVDVADTLLGEVVAVMGRKNTYDRLSNFPVGNSGCVDHLPLLCGDDMGCESSVHATRRS